MPSSYSDVNGLLAEGLTPVSLEVNVRILSDVTSYMIRYKMRRGPATTTPPYLSTFNGGSGSMHPPSDVEFPLGKRQKADSTEEVKSWNLVTNQSVFVRWGAVLNESYS